MAISDREAAVMVQFEQLEQAIEQNDDQMGGIAALLLAKGVVLDIARIADALEHIARNMPQKA